MTQELIRPLTDEEMKKRGWQVFINGEEIPEARFVEIKNEKMGVSSTYGQRAEGYDGVILREPNGGGSVILPYAILHGDLYIGVINQNRLLQGGEVPNTTRGFADPGETHFEAASREAEEELREAGVATDRLSTPHDIYTFGTNPNSAFFDTHGEGEGVHFFGMLIAPELLEEKSYGHATFRENFAKPASSMGERIAGCYFLPWWKFIREGDSAHLERARDGFTVQAIAMLLAQFREQDRLQLKPKKEFRI